MHVAQINIGTMIAPTDDPSVAEFMDNLERINAQADAAPGFVWRLQAEDGNATSIQIFPNPLQLVNMSVWESVAALKAYVYRTEHVEFFRRRAEWFESDAKRVALWWIPAGTTPELDDAVRRVEFLERHGPTPYAFGFGLPPAPLVFEPAEPADSQILDLVSTSNPGMLARIRGADSRTRMIQARHDGALIGCGVVHPIDRNIAAADVAFVDAQIRDGMIGAALLDQLELNAARSGLTDLRPAEQFPGW